LKRNNFINGAFIATLGIVVCKILGLVYVIPLYKIIGSQGGALYSYAYSIYAVFLNLSTAGIPTAISKIVSEYNALHQEKLQKRAFDIASKLLNIVGILSFIILFIFSDYFAHLIIGGTEGGNSVADVSIAIKIVSLALLVVPKLSILRGYFQGNKFITYSSVSTVIEQLVRVLLIIVGSYVSVKVFHLPINIAVYISILAATIGALASYLYLKFKIKRNKQEFEIQEINNEHVIDNKKLLKKILLYALPFVLISLLRSAYSVVDTFTVVKTLTSLGYTTDVAETTIGVFNTWGSKLNMIVVSISLGLITSLIPEITGSYAKKEFKNINYKINQSIKVLLFTTIPMAIGISLLASPIWTIFYGYDVVSVNIFSIYILQVIIYSLYITLINAVQAMNETKISLGVLCISFLLKVALNIPIMRFLYYINIDAYYGPAVTNAIVEFLSVMIILIVLKKKYNFKYKELFTPLLKIIVCLTVMLSVLWGLKYIYYSFNGIVQSVITIILFTIVGGLIYMLLSFRLKLINDIFGSNFFDKIRQKFSRKNKN